jgi:hypothetical protein
MLGTAFHNALRGLEPRRHSIGSRLIPAWWHRCQAPLLAFAFEAKPTLTVFARDGYTSPERSLSPIRRIPPLRKSSEAAGACRGRPAIDLSSLRCRGRHQPHLPPLARRIEKSPITHARSSVAVHAPRSVLVFSALQGGCHKASIWRSDVLFFSQRNVRSRESRFRGYSFTSIRFFRADWCRLTRARYGCVCCRQPCSERSSRWLES